VAFFHSTEKVERDRERERQTVCRNLLNNQNQPTGRTSKPTHTTVDLLHPPQGRDVPLGHTEFVVEGVVPELLYVVPVGHDALLDWGVESENISLGSSLVTDIDILLIHVRVFGSADNGGKDSAGDHHHQQNQLCTYQTHCRSQGLGRTFPLPHPTGRCVAGQGQLRRATLTWN
jgi:hypothetical protein